MTTRDFCYWIQGFFEVHGVPPSLSPHQVDTVRKHLEMARATDSSPGAAEFCATVSALLYQNQIAAVATVVAARFEHVLDKEVSYGLGVTLSEIHGSALRC